MIDHWGGGVQVSQELLHNQNRHRFQVYDRGKVEHWCAT